MTSRSRTALVLVALLAVLTGCGDDAVDMAGPSVTGPDPAATTAETPAPGVIEETADTGPAADTVTAVVQNTEELISFGQYMVVTETAVALGDGPYTVFAPTNDAFDALGEEFEQMSEEPQELEQIVRMHIVEGDYTADALEDGQILETMAGGELEVARDGDTVTVNGAEVVLPDLPASNGVVHGLGDVLTVNTG